MAPYSGAVRDLDWAGYPNCRDLGGLPTPWGFTRLGRVARGPRRELLSSAGWAAARSWGLKSIVDLRCSAEVGLRPGDPLLPEGLAAHVDVVSAPTEDHDNVEFRQTCFPILDSPAYWPHNLRILPSLVRGALLAVAAAEPGILIHCSAGRDRTGMVTALLLANAGVPADLVADDYAASVLAMAGATTHAPTPDRQAAWNQTQAAAWVGHTRPLVIEFATNITTHLDAVGLSEDVRQDLRRVLLGA